MTACSCPTSLAITVYSLLKQRHPCRKLASCFVAFRRPFYFNALYLALCLIPTNGFHQIFSTNECDNISEKGPTARKSRSNTLPRETFLVLPLATKLILGLFRKHLFGTFTVWTVLSQSDNYNVAVIPPPPLAFFAWGGGHIIVEDWAYLRIARVHTSGSTLHFK